MSNKMLALVGGNWVEVDRVNVYLEVDPVHTDNEGSVISLTITNEGIIGDLLETVEEECGQEVTETFSLNFYDMVTDFIIFND